MAALDDLYQKVFGRTADAAGREFWQGALDSGVSLQHVEQEFYTSDEYKSLQTTSAAAQPTTVLGKDISGLKWDDLAQEVHDGKLRNNPDGRNMDSAYTYSSILGGEVQGYVDTTQSNRNWKGNSREGGVDVYDWQSLSSINLKDEDAPEGYMTKLYRTEDGGIGVDYYEQKNGFLRDMILFAATAMGMYGAVTTLGAAASSAGATSGVSGTVGTAASGAGEVTLAEVGGEVATQTGFQVSNLTAPWEQVTTNALGSGMNGIEAVDGLLQLGTVTPEGFSLGGMTLTPSGELITAGSSFSASAAAAAPWVNPASSTITDVVVNSAGGSALATTELLAGTDTWSKFADVHTTGIPTVPTVPTGSTTPVTPTPAESNWWDKAVDVATDVGTGLVVGAVVDQVVGGSTPSAPTSPGVTINIPKPDPSAAALQPSASQRAGVKFGRTKSKRQLKGKFSGTGISL